MRVDDVRGSKAVRRGEARDAWREVLRSLDARETRELALKVAWHASQFDIICARFKMPSHPRQLELTPPTWGGRREGAGRKPSRGRRRVAHRRRAPHDRRCPVHVTLRASACLPSLRRPDVFGSMRSAFARASSGFGYFTSACSTTTFICSSRQTRTASCGGACKDSRFTSRRRSIARSAAAVVSGLTGITLVRSRRRARSVTRSCTCCRTSVSTCAERAGSICVPRHRGSLVGDVRSPRRPDDRPSSPRARGSHASAGGGVGFSVSMRRRTRVGPRHEARRTAVRPALVPPSPDSDS